MIIEGAGVVSRWDDEDVTGEHGNEEEVEEEGSPEEHARDSAPLVIEEAGDEWVSKELIAFMRNL